MSLRVICVTCQTELSVPQNLVGQTVQCSQCNQPLTISAAAPARPTAELLSPINHTRTSQSIWIVLLGSLGFLMLVLAAGMLYLLLNAQSSTPERVSAKVSQVSHPHVTQKEIIAAIDGLDCLDDVENIEQLVRDYQASGFRVVLGDEIIEESVIREPQIYICQTIELRKPVKTNVVIFADSAQIYSRVAGNVEFAGNTLSLWPDSVITGDVDSRACRRLTVQGEIRGQLTGQAKLLDWRNGFILNGGGYELKAKQRLKQPKPKPFFNPKQVAGKVAAEPETPLASKVDSEAKNVSITPTPKSRPRPRSRKDILAEKREQIISRIQTDSIRQIATTLVQPTDIQAFLTALEAMGTVVPNNTEQDEVVELMLSLFEFQNRPSNEVRLAILDVIRKWGTIDQAEFVVHIFGDCVFPGDMVDLLKHWKATQQLVEVFVICPHSTIRIRAHDALVSIGATELEIAKYSLVHAKNYSKAISQFSTLDVVQNREKSNELKEKLGYSKYAAQQRFKNSIDLLHRLKYPSQSTKTLVARALISEVHSWHSDEKAQLILRRTVTSEVAKDLLSADKARLQRLNYTRLLFIADTPATRRELVQQLAYRADLSQLDDYLPAVQEFESDLWPLLADQKRYRQVCRLLAKAGTPKSIPALEPYVSQQSFAASDAIHSIQRRFQDAQ